MRDRVHEVATDTATDEILASQFTFQLQRLTDPTPVSGMIKQSLADEPS